MLIAIERVLGMLNGATVLVIELLHFSEPANVGAISNDDQFAS